MTNHKAPTDRLTYTGDLTPVVEDICAAYNLGMLQDFSVIEVGYEDCNVIVDTGSERFLAKMFAKFRTPDDIRRYVEIIEKATAAGVHHPALVKTAAGEAQYTTNGITLSLLKFVEGETFYGLGRVPDAAERQTVIEQAAKIHQIDYKPPYLLDSWAITNVRSMFERVRQFVDPEDLVLAERAVVQYEAVPTATLPYAFVHGDIIKTNTLKGSDGKIYLLDFSVANWYPRIQELAVIASSLLADEHASSLEERCSLIADEYNQFNPLMETERQHLPAYALAAVAMEFMGAHQEKFINGVDTTENDYWLKLGREGLRRAFQEQGVCSMKLLLTSAGFQTPEIVNKCAELVGKPKAEINFAVINEAYAVEHGDHRWVLDDLNNIRDNFGGNIELVNLLALDLDTVKRRMEQADVVFVVGGNTDYLMSVFVKTGFDKLLPELLKTKVYVGSSAGSMVLGKRVSAEAYAKIYGDDGHYGIVEYLALVDLSILPHLGNPFFPKRKDVLLEATKDYRGTVYGLADDAAIVVDGDAQYSVGSEPVILHGRAHGRSKPK